MSYLKSVITGAAVVGLGLGVWSDTAQAQFYKGKTINVIIAAGAGGGLTRTARVFLAGLSRVLPGNPKIVIRNIPGAKGNNTFARTSKNDGLNLFWGPQVFGNVVTNAPGTLYDPAKFEVIGTGNSAFVSIIRSDTGVKKDTDLANIKSVTLGGIRPGGLLDMLSRLSMDSLGINYRYVTGYRNQPKMKAAIMSGEIQALTTGHPGYRAFYQNDLLEKGFATALFYHSPLDVKTGEPMRLKRYPKELRHYIDVYKDVTGKAPSGPGWEAYKWLATYELWPYWIVAPEGTPKNLVAELRKGYRAVDSDPEFRKQWAKQFIDFPKWAVGEEAQQLVNNFKNISPAALAIVKRAVTPGTAGKK